MKHSLDAAAVRALYDKEVEKHARDKRQHGPLDERAAMLRATKTLVHLALQLELPTEGPKDGEDADDTHYRQKKHGIALWKETDRLVAELEKTL
jgi:hypothetical protein